MAKILIKKNTVSGIKLKNFIQPSYRNLIIVFSILAVILVIAILYFALSQATIAITPAYKKQKTEFAIQVINKALADKNNMVPGRILGEIKETLIEATQEFPATSYQYTDEKAGGEITIINNYNKSQPLIATTRFLTPSGKLYRLVNNVIVPAGGSIAGQVLADQPGEQYETGITKLTIPGLWSGLQDKIYGETSGLTRQAKTRYVVTQKNIDEASNELRNQLISQTLNELSQGLADSQKITAEDLVVETIKYSTDAKDGDKKEVFNTTLSLGIKVVIFDQEELKQISYDNLPDIYEQNNSLVKIDPESFSYEITLIDENSENLIAQIKGDYTISVATIKINKNELKGLSLTEAKNYIMNLGNVERVSIRLPFWTKFLPTLTDNIDIQIKQ